MPLVYRHNSGALTNSHIPLLACKFSLYVKYMELAMKGILRVPFPLLKAAVGKTL